MRPSYVLSGAAMNVAHNHEVKKNITNLFWKLEFFIKQMRLVMVQDLEAYLNQAESVRLSKDHPVVIRHDFPITT